MIMIIKPAAIINKYLLIDSIIARKTIIVLLLLMILMMIDSNNNNYNYWLYIKSREIVINDLREEAFVTTAAINSINRRVATGSIQK